MSKKSSKAVEDSPDLMLDVKTMDALTRKMMETIMPNLEQMLKSAVDMMRHELKESLSQVYQELKESLTQSYAKIFDQRCTKIENQLKDISSETTDLRRQLNVL